MTSLGADKIVLVTAGGIGYEFNCVFDMILGKVTPGVSADISVDWLIEFGAPNVFFSKNLLISKDIYLINKLLNI
jgi:hypothetical protein